MVNWSKLLSAERFRPSSPPSQGDEANAFHSDYYRVVFSSAFRRLQDKTQVSPLAASDFVRRRLTHSLEVATVGERMGRVIAVKLSNRISGVPPDQIGKTVATACLLHDIGNPPFGHEGEIAIRAWADTRAPKFHDYCAFDGNAHGFRIAARLSHYGQSHGLNLTAATLASIVKYPTGAATLEDASTTKRTLIKKRGKYGYFESEKKLFETLWQRVDLPLGRRHPLSFVMEAADDIVNRLVDLEDGIKLGLISYDIVRDCLVTAAKVDFRAEKLLNELDARYGEITKRFGASLTPGAKKNAQQLAFQHFRTVATAAFSASAQEAFVKRIDDIEAGKFTGELLPASDFGSLYEALRKIEYANIFGDQSIVRVEAGGKEALRGLLDIFYKAVGNDPDFEKLGGPVEQAYVFEGEPRLDDEYVKIQRVVDYVAGMTDRFAITLYQQLSGMSL
jgi:dGTPase